MKPTPLALPTFLVLCTTAPEAAAQQATSAPVHAPAPPPGEVAALASPACAKALDDTSGPGCLRAASTPTLGKLFPLSSDLYIDSATGNVCLGGTSPAHRLEVLGTGHFTDDLSFGDAQDSIVFPANGDTNAPPMIHMFSAGSTNRPRMVIAHSPAFPNWGLHYDDLTDRFTFQNEFFGIQPTLTIDLGTEVEAAVPFRALGGVEASHAASNVPALEVLGSAASYSGPFDPVAMVRRTTSHGAGENLLGLVVPTGSPSTGQYIECANTTGGYEIDFRVDTDGEVFSDVGITTPADFAEMIEVSTGAGSVEPGDVVAIDPAQPRSVVRSTRAHSTLVAGVYSTKPGVVGSEREWDEPAPAGSPEALAGQRVMLKRADMARLHDEVPVAVVGIVPCKVSAENGPIQPGDLLVTSTTPGHAMRADAPSTGTVVGKALDSLANGTGKIRILVTLQ